MFHFTGILIWTVLHVYLFQRISHTPPFQDRLSRKKLVMLGLLFWLSYPVSQALEHGNYYFVFKPVTTIGANWFGALLLLTFCMALVDGITLFGLLFAKVASKLRSMALAVGILLTAIALVQGYRAPVVSDYEVVLPKLPAWLDGTVMVAMTDLHLGTMYGEAWLGDRVEQVHKLNPDAIVFVGDIFEGDGPLERYGGLVKRLKQFNAPLGVWGVTGNHEIYPGIQKSLTFLRGGGVNLLHGRSVTLAPGLVLAGIDDPAVRKRADIARDLRRMQKPMAESASILLSHRPNNLVRISDAGADLVISGHTHAGQLWPFTFILKKLTPFVEGLYEIKGMTAIVCRGTGTWGPRMRLWQRSEILRIVLRNN